MQGYTEHGFRHVGLVAHIAQNILLRLDRPPSGTPSWRRSPATCTTSATPSTVRTTRPRARCIAKDLLRGMGMRWDEVAIVMGAIGNHEERIGEPVSATSAPR